MPQNRVSDPITHVMLNTINGVLKLLPLQMQLVAWPTPTIVCNQHVSMSIHPSTFTH